MRVSASSVALRIVMAKETVEEVSGGVRSVERAARIVTALAEHPFPMSITELAGRVNLSPPSVHRLLATLVGIGWVEKMRAPRAIVSAPG